MSFAKAAPSKGRNRTEIVLLTRRVRGNCAKHAQIPVFISDNTKEPDMNKGDTTAVLTSQQQTGSQNS